MKKAAALLLILAITAMYTVYCSADVSGEYTYTALSGNTAEITAYSGSEANLIIPEKIGGNTVTSIAENAFSGSETIVSVILPNTLNSLGAGAFSDCSSLQSIAIPSGVTAVRYKTFEDCVSLSSLTLESGLETISDYAFSGCSSLSKITIPKTVTFIGEDVFGECDLLESISVDSQNEFYESDNSVLYSAGKLDLLRCPQSSKITDFIVPDTVTSIAANAFEDCYFLKSVTMNGNVESVGDSAFFGCENLESLRLSPKISEIGSYCFASSGITSLRIYPGVTTIGESAFDRCKSLKRIIIPNSTETIEKNVFNGCGNVAIGCTSLSYAAAYAVENNILVHEMTDCEVNRVDYAYPVKGDVDGDERVTATDALITMQVSINSMFFGENQYTAANVDGDSKISVTDALIILQFSVGKITQF